MTVTNEMAEIVFDRLFRTPRFEDVDVGLVRIAMQCALRSVLQFQVTEKEYIEALEIRNGAKGLPGDPLAESHRASLDALNAVLSRRE